MTPVTMSSMDEIRWIEGDPSTKLAIVLRPRGGDWLDDEMQRIRRGGIDTLVSLLERLEADWLELSEEQNAAEHAGLHFLNYPIPDRTVPQPIAPFCAFTEELAQRVRNGEHIGFHCRGCIGRATITAACTLIHLGWKPADALDAIERARGLPVPDTPEQRDWILRYEAAP